jgi:hypothetical protein
MRDPDSQLRNIDNLHSLLFKPAFYNPAIHAIG